ncbi:MAG: alpha/beta hydrolase [Clostridia bacterium]|nr:alpha/beta hydrolase [Clostridia bacterium]
MLDFLNKVDIVPERFYGDTMRGEVEPYLQKKGRMGELFASDGTKLHYEAYEKLLSRGSIVILHGFTESAEKFREVAYYLRKAGYSVFVPDMRGHGKSAHKSKKTERVEIDSFERYADDLHLFIESVVKPATVSGKVYIYSHSLGSTVALLYMMKHSHTVQKAVLSSPMICGNMGMPVAVAGTVAKLLCALGGSTVSAPGRCVFDSSQTAEKSDAVSPERFSYYHEKRKREPLYQTSGPSFGWVKASIEARDRILSDEGIKKLRGKMLIFKPEEDRQLLGDYTDKFAEKAHIKIKKVKNSRHEIFMSGDETLSWYYGEILEFFSEL